jgi:hypothetical protein
MSEELKMGQPDGANPPAETGQTAADTGGRPDNVWRDHREYESLRKTLESKGFSIDELKTNLGNMPTRSELEKMQEQMRQSNVESPPAGGYDEGEEFLSKREAAQLLDRVMRAEMTLESLRNESAAERLEREAAATGLTPTLQKAYKALRQQYPDTDPVQLKAELSSVVQATIQQAKKQGPAPTISPQKPVSEAEKGPQYSGSAREQMAQWAKDAREAILARLSESG